jgi:hypothetical protein
VVQATAVRNHNDSFTEAKRAALAIPADHRITDRAQPPRRAARRPVLPGSFVSAQFLVRRESISGTSPVYAASRIN